MSIQQLAASIREGTTTNSLVCPTCGGGNSKDKSLSITKEAGLIKWICFRASCDERGAKADNPNNWALLPIAEAKPVDHFTGATVAIPDKSIELLRDKYSLADHITSDLLVHKNYVVLPIKDHNGRTTGHVLKKIRGEGTKSIIYGERQQMHYATTGDSVCVIVEDWLSAERVGAYVDSVALLGTNLNQAQVVQLAEKYDKLYFMLDADAWNKAIYYCTKYNLLFNEGCSYLTWDSQLDPKDMGDDELKTIIETHGI